MEKVLLLVLSAIYLIAFIARNVVVKLRTGQQIRSNDPLPMVSIVLSSMCFAVTISSAFFDSVYLLTAPIILLDNVYFAYIGLVVFSISIIVGWFVSAQLKDSWRIGVVENQQTKLITDGIYGYIRNPYFLSYHLMFIGLFLVQPSWLLLALIVITAYLFHLMIMKEEVYLEKLHGKDYLDYMSRTGRYFYLPGMVSKTNK